MIHSMHFKNGQANYTNKFVETDRYKQEMLAGGNIYMRLGELKGITGIIRVILFRLQRALGLVAPKFRDGPANTNIIYHHNSILSLYESSLPFEVILSQNGELSSIGWEEFNGEWEMPFTAHPKIDPVTKELVFFGYQLEKPPYVKYGVADASGKIIRKLDINIPDPVMMHDFAITPHYSIIMDLPLLFTPKNIINGSSAFTFSAERGSRFGILPRHATSEQEIQWFNTTSCFIFHTLNAWEEGDEVVLIASRLSSLELDVFGGIEDASIHEWRFNLHTGKLLERVIVTGARDFPRTHPDYTGKKCRYGYFSIIENEPAPIHIPGFIKLDLETDSVKTFLYGEAKFGGELLFVPKKDEYLAEDEGYLMTFVHDEKEIKSSFWIVDARTLEIEAIIDIPTRVPYGFHANFLTAEDLEEANMQ